MTILVGHWNVLGLDHDGFAGKSGHTNSNRLRGGASRAGFHLGDFMRREQKQLILSTLVRCCGTFKGKSCMTTFAHPDPKHQGLCGWCAKRSISETADKIIQEANLYDDEA